MRFSFGALQFGVSGLGFFVLVCFRLASGLWVSAPSCTPPPPLPLLYLDGVSVAAP